MRGLADNRGLSEICRLKLPCGPEEPNDEGPAGGVGCPIEAGLPRLGRLSGDGGVATLMRGALAHSLVTDRGGGGL